MWSATSSINRSIVILSISQSVRFTISAKECLVKISCVWTWYMYGNQGTGGEESNNLSHVTFSRNSQSMANAESYLAALYCDTIFQHCDSNVWINTNLQEKSIKARVIRGCVKLLQVILGRNEQLTKVRVSGKFNELLLHVFNCIIFILSTGNFTDAFKTLQKFVTL